MWHFLKVLSLLPFVIGLMIVGAVSKTYLFWGEIEEIRFQSGDITLSGAISYPKGKAPFPFVVIGHDSGPETRDNIATHAVGKYFNRVGFAVLMFDKRGTGASEGEFEKSGLVDFQRDLTAAVDYVLSRDDAHANKIGVYANGESSWYAPQIVLSRARISFLIQKSGTTFSWGETVAWLVEDDAQKLGFSREYSKQIANLAVLRWDYKYQVAIDPKNVDSSLREKLLLDTMLLFDNIDNAERIKLEWILERDAVSHPRFASNYSFDPGKALQSLDIPILFLLGENDDEVPVQNVISQIEEWQSEGLENIEYRIVPGVGNSLLNHPIGVLNEGLVPVYLVEIGAFLAEREELSPL